MECILHIGTEKTGTTTVQEFLHMNRNLLRSHRVLFPRSAGLRNNRRLSVAAFSPDRRDDYTKNLGLITDKELVDHQKSIIDDLGNELRKAKGIDTVIFSSEQLHSRLGTTAEIENLRKILKSLGFERISVVVYLREQVDAMTSLCNTAVMSGATTFPPPKPWEQEYWSRLCDHKTSILKWREVFGLNSVKPRLFIKDSFSGHSIFDDFMEACEIRLPKNELDIPINKNESISRLGLEVLSRLNRSIPPWLVNGEPNPERRAVVQIIRSAFNDGPKFRLPPEIAEQCRERYRDSNEWVRREYFPERRELFPSMVHNPSTPMSLDTIEIDQVADVIELLLKEVKQHKAEGGVTLSGKQLIKQLARRFVSKGTEPTKRCTRRP